GCGCGIEHKTVVAGINDCLSESVAQGSRNVGKTTPIKVHIECCKNESCKKEK
ncbi:unnamed protein product, partial [Mesorhabditis belari]|uniref:Uncharacterized protein n=1 Tax=Mesorhabditis belari TaxID=2138241 RepID=A0AAF3F6A3_9BILA